jgi:outer membrane protein
MRYGASLLSAALFLFWSLILSPFPVFSQGKARFYTLQESIEEALANNYSFKAKQEQVDQAMQAKKQARADFFPKLSTRYSYTRFDEERTFRSTLMGGGEVAISSLDNYEWRGTVTQPLFTGFALISSFELAKLGIDQSEMDVELVKLDLALKVKEAYFDILIADKAVEVAKDAVESLESHVKVARSFYKVGMIPVNDVLKAEVELANAKQNLVKANNASRLARSAFNIVLSRPINALVEVEDILLFKPERGEFPEYVREALNNRPEMKLIDISILQTDQQIRLANSKNFPEIGFTFDYIKAGDEPSVSGSPFHDENEWRATAALSWTFWEWGKTHYSIKEIESLKRELMQNRMALKDSISLELREAVLELETTEENIPTTRKAIEQGEENLRVNEERYKAQVTTITEVLDAQTLLTQARVNYYNALYNHHLAKAKLLRALGRY